MRVLRSCLFVLALATISVGLLVDTTHAADARNFNPADIMSDFVMTNKNSMTEAQIQSFLKNKVNCNDTNLSKVNRDASGYYLINSSGIRLNYNVQNGHFVCMPDENFGGETATRIIWQAGQDYNINPQVLIVLLQKEQGLISDSWPNSVQYRSATGYGCPDTAACDSEYYGFKNQVRNAARFFRAYQDNNPGWYKPYWTGSNTIKWHPNSGCGTSSVNIANRATASLYSYTPYRPNQAALNAQYGTGDSCSSYGNRNFWLYFTDWFGSTSYTVTGSIGKYYNSIGGENSILGRPIANQNPTCRWGYYQRFENGYIIGKWDTGYWATRGSIRTQYVSVGTEHGVLGFPVADEYQVIRSGNKQYFEFGYIVGKWDTKYWSVRGSIRTQYDAQDMEGGKLGFPLNNESSAPGGGNQQLFENGSIVGRWDTKYWVVGGKVSEHYKTIGGPGSVVGYPLQPELATQTGSYQRFNNGYIIGKSQTGYWVVRGNIRAHYATLGAEHGELGFPTGSEFVENNQYRQDFENGYIIGKNGSYTHYIY